MQSEYDEMKAKALETLKGTTGQSSPAWSQVGIAYALLALAEAIRILATRDK
ncbi:MAG: hypothetical protein WCV92_05015 [Candidatus Buchananbacteria bacterium]